ncbi:MAG: 50S ribosomal protein L7/L12 [Planctomycetes bacterium]|nr:50S ribosomal protein L7/L12 [Planctomycetota bacterium]
MSDATTIELEPKLQSIVKDLDGLTLLEASKIVKHLEKHWGVSAAAPVAMAAAPAAAAAAAVEKTTFSVILENSGDKKIQVIKEVRAITGLGLKEAKDLVDAAPKAIKEGVTKEEAAEIKAKVESAGGKVKVD